MSMSVQVYGCNHIAIEVDNIERAVAFYQDVFNLERMSEGEGDAFFRLGEHNSWRCSKSIGCSKIAFAILV